MKYVIALFLIVSTSLYLTAQPNIEFGKKVHDYGNISEEDGLAETVFEFQNTGDAPLILNNVKASCGCTTPEWTKDPIAPGKTGSIKVPYNTKNRTGSFSKNITVYSNTQPSVNVLNIKGQVSPREKTVEELFPRVMGPLRFKSNYLALGNVYNHEVKDGEFNFINSSAEPAKIGVHRAPDFISVSFEPEVVQPGKEGVIKIKYDASKKGSYGYASDRIYLSINGEKNNTYSASISLQINEDFSKLSEEDLANAPVAVFDNKTFEFGNITQGEKATHSFKLTNRGKSDLLIRNVKTSCGCTAVQHENVVKPSQTIDLKIEFNSRGKSSRQNKSITVTTNDPKNPTTVLRIMGTVVVPE